MFLLVVVSDSFVDDEEDQDGYDNDGNVPGIQHVDRRWTEKIFLNCVDFLAVKTATDSEEIDDLLRKVENASVGCPVNVSFFARFSVSSTELTFARSPRNLLNGSKSQLHFHGLWPRRSLPTDSSGTQLVVLRSASTRDDGTLSRLKSRRRLYESDAVSHRSRHRICRIPFFSRGSSKLHQVIR